MMYIAELDQIVRQQEEIESLRTRVAELEATLTLHDAGYGVTDREIAKELAQQVSELKDVRNSDIAEFNALKDELAAVTKERDHWEETCHAQWQNYQDVVIPALKAKLAASQHYAQQLREALTPLVKRYVANIGTDSQFICCVTPNCHGDDEALSKNEVGNEWLSAMNILSIPHDTSALDEMRKDAERYRWLREDPYWPEEHNVRDPEELDAAIDNAMKGQA